MLETHFRYSMHCLLCKLNVECARSVYCTEQPCCVFKAKKLDIWHYKTSSAETIQFVMLAFLQF